MARLLRKTLAHHEEWSRRRLHFMRSKYWNETRRSGESSASGMGTIQPRPGVLAVPQLILYRGEVSQKGCACGESEQTSEVTVTFMRCVLQLRFFQKSSCFFRSRKASVP